MSSAHNSTNALIKIASGDSLNLSPEDIQAIDSLISVLQKARNCDELSKEEQAILKPIITKIQKRKFTLDDFYTIVRILFKLSDFFKDYT